MGHTVPARLMSIRADQPVLSLGARCFRGYAALSRTADSLGGCLPRLSMNNSVLLTSTATRLVYAVLGLGQCMGDLVQDGVPDMKLVKRLHEIDGQLDAPTAKVRLWTPEMCIAESCNGMRPDEFEGPLPFPESVFFHELSGEYFYVFDVHV